MNHGWPTRSTISGRRPSGDSPLIRKPAPSNALAKRDIHLVPMTMAFRYPHPSSFMRFTFCPLSLGINPRHLRALRQNRVIGTQPHRATLIIANIARLCAIARAPFFHMVDDRCSWNHADMRVCLLPKLGQTPRPLFLPNSAPFQSPPVACPNISQNTEYHSPARIRPPLFCPRFRVRQSRQAPESHPALATARYRIHRDSASIHCVFTETRLNIAP